MNQIKSLGVLSLMLAFITPQISEASRHVGKRRATASVDKIIKRDRQLVEDAIAASRMHRFSIAIYKLRIIKLDLKKLPNHPSKATLKNAVNLSIQKLNDPWLSSYDKVDIMVDCGAVALDALRDLKKVASASSGMTLTKAMDIVDKLDRFVIQNRLSRAVQLSQHVRKGIRHLRLDSDVKTAIEALKIIEQKLSDPGLALSDKLYIVQDCQDVIEDAIKRSHAYGVEMGWY